MPAATIVFTDIVSFSKKPTSDQRLLINELNAEVIHELRTLLQPATGRPEIIALPTGDGMALAFLHEPGKTWDRDTLLRFIIRLHRWAFAHGETACSVELRVGVHVGAVELITDINGRVNVCGDTINYTQRVMDAANCRQTLFSEPAIREYIGCHKEVTVSTPLGEVELTSDGPIEVFAKHGMQVPVVQLKVNAASDLPAPVEGVAASEIGKGKPKFWHNDEPPEAKHLMAVKMAAKWKPIEGQFATTLSNARRIALVQLTGDRLLKGLIEQKVKLSDELERLWVFMPDPELALSLWLPQNTPEANPITADIIREQIAQWNQFLAEFRKQRPMVEVKLGVFQAPLYFGASFLNWDQPKGRIHVSPCVWGKRSSQWPGYELEWLGSRPAEVYETYVAALNHLHANTADQTG
jgi:class 3 adenylate cyclase